MNFLTPLCAVAMAAAFPVFAHDDHCSAVMNSVAEAGFDDRVTVTCPDDTQAIITSDTYPPHTLMTGIVGTNEQIPVPADYAAPIILQPQPGTTPMTRDAALGVAVNGVPIYDYTGGGEMTQADLAIHQAQHDTVETGQLDVCGGHAGRGDDYHYHAKPVCMIEAMDNAGENPIIGWAFDGFPIYGDDNPDGSPIAADDLDVCNGQPDDVFGYRYHSSDGPPYIVQCLMGVVSDFDALPRVRPLSSADGGPGPEAGRPPAGGVEDLVFQESAEGQRTMRYSYQGVDYYISYAPSDTPGCYDFETRTITNNGVLFEQELCR